MNLPIFSQLFLVFVLALAACQGQPLNAPTEATNTPNPSPPSTGTAEAKPTRTNPPTAYAGMPLGRVQNFVLAGYSFQPLQNFVLGVHGLDLQMGEPAGSLNIYIKGARKNSQEQTAEALIASYLDWVGADGNGELKLGQSAEITIDGASGLIADFSGSRFATPWRGQLATVLLSGNRYWSAIAIANSAAAEQVWREKGAPAFQTLLGSLKFIDQPALPGGPTRESACPVSAETSFGYTLENPVPLGGGDTAGPRRQQLYLEALSGPHGEPLSYQRSGLVDSGENSLDAYVIFGLDNPFMLYLNRYADLPPQAPQGLICAHPSAQ